MLGRKPKLSADQQRKAIRRPDAGEPVREIARTYNVGRSMMSKLMPLVCYPFMERPSV